MCEKCRGLGNQFDINHEKIIPDDNISIDNGGIIPLGEKKNNWGYRQMEVIAKRYKFLLTDPIKKIPKNGTPKIHIICIKSIMTPRPLEVQPHLIL